MANPVSIGFSTPLCFQQTSRKKIYWEKTTLRGLSKNTTARTGINRMAPCSSNRGLVSLNLSCQHPLASSSKHLNGIVSCLDGSSCTHNMIITGYWVGPDIDDGWGFVEASINRIT